MQGRTQTASLKALPKMDTPERSLHLRVHKSVMCINEEHIRAVMIWRSAKFLSHHCPQTNPKPLLMQ